MQRATGASKGGGLVLDVFVTVVPAVVLIALGVSQCIWTVTNWGALSSAASLVSIAIFTRSVLYAAFVLGTALTLLTNGRPSGRDARGSVVVISLVASFLMVGANIAPNGPTLWSESDVVTEAGVFITLIGALLAFIAFTVLGSSFSVAPEARALMTSGPYRIVRHPMYLAELLMIAGSLVDQAQLTTLVGTLIVVALQIRRIRSEENLLGRAFPAPFEHFAQLTRYRLIPGLW